MKIEIIGGQAPSGRWVFLEPDFDKDKFDESKLQRFIFEVEPQTTKHTVSANGIAFEVVERLGLSPDFGEAVKPGAYNAAHRLSVAILRCQKVTHGEDIWQPPTLAEFLGLPPEILQQYQYNLREADDLTKEDLDFFHKQDVPKPESKKA